MSPDLFKRKASKAGAVSNEALQERGKALAEAIEQGGDRLPAANVAVARDLDRKVADKRIFPAIDVLKSGTRKEDLITPKDQLAKTYVLRRILNPMGTTDAIEFLISKLKQTKTNSDFFESMNA